MCWTGLTVLWNVGFMVWRSLVCTFGTNGTRSESIAPYCVTDYKYATLGDQNPFLTYIGCDASSARDYYLATATTTSTTLTTPSTSTASSSVSSSTVTCSSQAISCPPPVPPSGSKAWIAGAVLGPIVLLAIIGALIWFLLGKKRKQSQMPPQTPAHTGHQFGGQPQPMQHHMTAPSSPPPNYGCSPLGMNPHPGGWNEQKTFAQVGHPQETAEVHGMSSPRSGAHEIAG
ncbi:uncharacterized protein BDZ99DRAFT_577002 [Mytilinidion resinicola]|uniref:Mid2 domain-containing protein n=1 Tax=Mytilinidion resinicola TaxID=574789 RepID=A0A6A6Y267_9PEZI|nr:uncharacterized protein BDZ99DRAFT_577002 [Mytilinidion resinicola]KAF2802315.1 hypothetical protein BDZ99DRAFT_577002 [Mytilinidion resinicola]